MKPCPVCSMEQNEHEPSHCEQCGWDLKNDLTRFAFLESPADNAVRKYELNLEIAKKNWAEKQLDLEKIIEAAPPGSTIELKAVKYLLKHPLEIKKEIHLRGKGENLTIISGDEKGFVVKFTGDCSYSFSDIGFVYEGQEAATVVVSQAKHIEFNQCIFTNGKNENVTVGAIRDQLTSCNYRQKKRMRGCPSTPRTIPAFNIHRYFNLMLVSLQIDRRQQFNHDDFY